jgi:NAD(P)-dependent dehydrogenase (short-subunit alcohol dehydrogenase family)
VHGSTTDRLLRWRRHAPSRIDASGVHEKYSHVPHPTATAGSILAHVADPKVRRRRQMSVESHPALKGAVALVTGASGGIGRAVCAALSAAGARVVATDLGEAPQELRVDAWWKHDVTSAHDWTRVVDEIRSQFGRLDCLINNAGISLVERIADTSLEQWRKLMSVNVEGVLLGLQASLPLLRASGSDRAGGSSVVNVSSAAGLRGVAFNVAYCASKGAVTLLTKSAAKEFAELRYPIRVNSIHPGAVETDMMDSIVARYVELGSSTSIEETRAAFMARNPLGRMARPKEIAGGVVFLCSPTASFMTGSELVIDGGVTA